jgi:DNA-binding CsgD family transcriptional regulator
LELSGYKEILFDFRASSLDTNEVVVASFSSERRVRWSLSLMPKSALLSGKDIRQAMRVVGECRDVGRDPSAWNLRVACYFLEQLRAVFTSCFTHSLSLIAPEAPQLLHAFWSDNRLHVRWTKFVANHGYRNYPSVQIFMERFRGGPLTLTRQDMIPDRAWRDSEERRDRRSIKQDELLISAHPAENGVVHAFSINRADGDAPFSARDKALVSLVHEELGRLFGATLSVRLETQALPTDLPPRLQSVVICLLSGDSDKEIARRLGLSVHTIHEYVTTLFRRLGVHSRAELFVFAARSGWLPGTASLPPKQGDCGPERRHYALD